MSSSPIPNTGDPRVDAALGRIRGKFTDLEDASLVQAHLEKSLGDNVDEFKKRISESIDELQNVMVLHNKGAVSNRCPYRAGSRWPTCS